MTDASFVAVSDVHLDTFDGMTSAQTQQLVTLDPADWSKFLLEHCGPPTRPGSHMDANTALYEAVRSRVPHALTDDQGNATGPDFLVYPGDFLRHECWSHARQSGLDHDQQHKLFVGTVEMVLDGLTSLFEGVPVFMTFGNDDSSVGDYRLRYDGTFLADVAPSCRRAFGSADVDDDQLTTTGCYAATLPGLGHRLISLSNVFWSHSRWGSEPGAKDVLDYLDDQLGEAAATGQRVWLLMHIPPGGSCYVSGHGGSRRVHHGRNWHHHDQVAFQQTIDRHDVAIDIAFAGHTHMDDFRIWRHSPGGQPRPLLVKIVPGVSPKFGQNPGFQLYRTTGGAVSDWTTHYLDGDDWQSYVATDSYGAVDPASLLRTFEAMRSDTATGTAYRRDYAVRRTRLEIPSEFLDSFVGEVIAGAPTAAAPILEYSETPIPVEDAMLEMQDALG